MKINSTFRINNIINVMVVVFYYFRKKYYKALKFHYRLPLLNTALQRWLEAPPLKAFKVNKRQGRLFIQTYTSCIC